MGWHMIDDLESEIIHRELDTNTADPRLEVVSIIAELEQQDPEALTSIWECIDDVLTEIFSNPPASKAQMEITFSYEGYRITVEQNGRASFVKLD